jgi:hypothetical protein
MMWVGFAGCIVAYLLTTRTKSVFNKRMVEALRPMDEEVNAIMQEQHDDEMGRSLIQRVLQPILVKLGAR